MEEIKLLDNKSLNSDKYPKYASFYSLKSAFSYGVLVVCKRFRFDLNLVAALLDKICKEIGNLLVDSQNQQDVRDLYDLLHGLMDGQNINYTICYGMVEIMNKTLFGNHYE